MRVRSQQRWSLRPVVLAVGLIGSGCAGSGATAQELAALRTELTALRSTTGGISERLDALEIKAGALRTTAAIPAPTDTEPRGSERPDLPTVKLTPDTRAETAEVAPSPSGPRMRFKSTPNGIIQEEASGDDSAAVDLNRLKPKPKAEPPKGTDKKPEKR